MLTRFALPALVLLAFGAFTTELVAADGYSGFLRLAARDPWALQMLLDVTIACTIALLLFVVPDAKKHGIAWWPYLVATVFLGSLGLLAYLVHRRVAQSRAARVVGTGSTQPSPAS